MKISKGMLSGHRTKLAVAVTIAGTWAAFLFDMPVMGEEVPLTLGAAIGITLAAVIAFYQRLATEKVQKAAEKERVKIVNRSIQAKHLLLAAALPAVLALSGCFAARAREHVLFPAVQLASSGVFADAEAGIDAATVAGDMTGDEATTLRAEVAGLAFAIASSDRQGVADRLGTWEEVVPLVEAGINAKLAAGLIGPNGALSKLERLMNFDEAIRELVEDLR